LYLKQLAAIRKTARIGFTPDVGGVSDSIGACHIETKKLDWTDSTVVA
jgi:hypothetical protein